jgi:hypothetical protein
MFRDCRRPARARSLGHIYAQLWHAGRASDPSLLNGERPVGPSAIPATGIQTRVDRITNRLGLHRRVEHSALGRGRGKIVISVID